MQNLALTFLDPLTGLVVAGAAVPALLLLYFLKLRRRPVRVTASFLWQQAADDLQVNTPFRWLRVSLVLLLQLLALLLLCAAIARPAMNDLPPASGRVILLLDASASMRADDVTGGGTRFAEAKRRATEFVGSLELGGADAAERTEAMVILFAHEPRVLANFTTDQAELLGAIARAEPTDQPGDLAAALELVDAFARAPAEGDESRPPMLALFTDGGEAHGASSFTVAASEVRFVRAGPAPTEAKSNLGVSALSVRRDDADPANIRIFARLVNASGDPVGVAPALEIDGRAMRAERVIIPGATEEGPGEAALAFEAPAPDRAIVTLRVPNGGALASDDSASLVIDPPGGVSVTIIAPIGTIPGRAAPDMFLREAIDALRPRVVRTMTLAQHDEAIRSGDRAPGSLLASDLIIYDRVEPSVLLPIPTLSFGAGLPIEGLRVSPAAEPSRPTRFLSWRRTDPLLRSVSLGETLVARPMRMTLPELGVGGVTSVEPLAFGDGGPLIASMTVGGAPHAIVAFDLAQSTWPLDVGFAVFMANAVETLAPRAAMVAGRSFTTREAMVLSPAPGAERVIAEGPTTLEARVTGRGASGVVSLGVPPFVGVYSVRGVDDADSVAPVNLADASESAIRTSDSLPIATRAGASTAAGEAAPREVWHWFVLAAVGFLALEWLLFAWRMRL